MQTAASPNNSRPTSLPSSTFSHPTQTPNDPVKRQRAGREDSLTMVRAQYTRLPSSFPFLPLLPLPRPPSPPNPFAGQPPSTPKQRRHAYTLKTKVTMIKKVLEIKATLSAQSLQPPTITRVLKIASYASGVPVSNLDKWLRKSADLLALFEDKKNKRRARKLGAGRTPQFPLSEEQAGKEARERRNEDKITSKRWVLATLKRLAEQENKDAFLRFKFSADFFADFLRRQRLALRVPSCTKAMSLDEGVLAARGWFQWLRKLIRDEWPNGAKYALAMTADEGRFKIDCRLNKDEVHFIPVASPV